MPDESDKTAGSDCPSTPCTRLLAWLRSAPGPSGIDQWTARKWADELEALQQGFTADGNSAAEHCCGQVKLAMKTALADACELFGEIERDEVNHQDEAGKWLRAYGHYAANDQVVAPPPKDSAST